MNNPKRKILPPINTLSYFDDSPIIKDNILTPIFKKSSKLKDIKINNDCDHITQFLLSKDKSNVSEEIFLKSKNSPINDTIQKSFYEMTPVDFSIDDISPKSFLSMDTSPKSFLSMDTNPKNSFDLCSQKSLSTPKNSLEHSFINLSPIKTTFNKEFISYEHNNLFASNYKISSDKNLFDVFSNEKIISPTYNTQSHITKLESFIDQNIISNESKTEILKITDNKNILPELIIPNKYKSPIKSKNSLPNDESLKPETLLISHDTKYKSLNPNKTPSIIKTLMENLDNKNNVSNYQKKTREIASYSKNKLQNIKYPVKKLIPTERKICYETIISKTKLSFPDTKILQNISFNVNPKDIFIKNRKFSLTDLF